MSLYKNRFARKFPDAFFLEKEDTDSLRQYLYEKDWLEDGEQLVHVDLAGEGNMNLVLKVETSQKEFIIKQARPWVEKYPDIDAPIERIHAEATYYIWHQENEHLQTFVPDIPDYDPDNYILFLEYLGNNADGTYLYKQGSELQKHELDNLLEYIFCLHQTNFSKPIDAFPDNSKLKKLNHQHLFIYPFLINNGLDLDSIQPGLQELALPYIKNDNLQKRVTQLGDLYLSEGPSLLHGDYYPGSWIRTDDGFKIIDPEFSHFGQPEFDLGVFTAHMYIAQQPERILQSIKQNFHQYKHFDTELAISYTGIEILRRLIGLAQLSTPLTIDQKSELLRHSCKMVLTPSNYI